MLSRSKEKKMTQGELERFVALWQSETVRTVAEIADAFGMTAHEASALAHRLRQQLRQLDPPVELIDRRTRRQASIDYTALARAAKGVE